MKTLFSYLVVMFALVSCAGGAESSKPVVAVISVRASGEFFVDGVKADIRELHLVLTARRKTSGEVWIHRTPSREGLRSTLEVVEIVRSYGFDSRPIRFDPLKPVPTDARYRSR
jgi:hypothetical protein